MINFLRKYKYQFILMGLVLLLFVVNYIPKTHLSGWDNLQIELNPGLAVKRSFFSVWEEYQSMGLVAGMAHAADLVRAVFLWLMSFVLPQNMIRYFFHFSMLLLGGLGMFEMLKMSLRVKRSNLHNEIASSSTSSSPRDDNSHETMKQSNYEAIAFLGALFYMLNLGTLQIFYLPFESFSTFFAFLPWGIWIFKKILNIKYQISKKDILIFLIINLLGTPAFYTQQLFIVYILALGCIGLGWLIGHSGERGDGQSTNDSRIKSDSGRVHSSPTRSLARMTMLFFLIFFINSFWIMPQIYFLKTNGSWVTRAKASQIATEDTLYQNLEKGTLDNFLRLEGFYYDLSGILNTPLFTPWKEHFKGVFRVLPILLGILGILGIINVMLNLFQHLKKKVPNQVRDDNGFAFLLLFFLCALALLSATPPFSWLNTLLRQSSFINQIFRSPFTKFIVLYSFVYSFFVAEGLFFIRTVLLKTVPKRTVLYVLTAALIILYSLPSFRGLFMSPEMKVKIPSDYIQVMDYFKTIDKNKRIALLPDYTFWGWFFNKWGYNGSGFLWYGIEQPIISRTFDVWSSVSESYFWEIKQALEAENAVKIERVFDKYNVHYLLMDYSLIPLVSSYKSLATDRIENILRKSDRISLLFKGSNIALFQVNRNRKIDDFIEMTSGLINIGPSVDIMAEDRAYQENGIYLTETSKTKQNPEIYYPFANLTTQTKVKDSRWQLEEKDSLFKLSSKIDVNPKKFNLVYQASGEAILNLDHNIKRFNTKISPKITEDALTVDFDKYLLESFDLSTVDHKAPEISFSLPELPQRYGYLVKTKTKNISGVPYFFYILDETKNQSMVEEKLRSDTNYFIIPKKYQYGLGYSFSFQNKSYKKYPSINSIEEVSVYLFPYEQLKNIKFTKKNAILTFPKIQTDVEAEKINYFTYKAFIHYLPTEASAKEGVLILYQSFDPGWLAFADGKLLPHVKVNNWANGWVLDDRSQILDVRQDNLKSNIYNLRSVYIVFWPQYLQFAGFGILIITFFYILKIKN